MKILILSDSESAGGAAIAASRLAVGLAEAGHHITRVVAQRDGQAHPWVTVQLRPRLPIAIRALLRVSRGKGWTWVRRAVVTREFKEVLLRTRPDVVSVHNLHGAAKHGWSLDLVDIAARVAPTAWTLHDMWSFTGRCAHAMSCRRFLAGCDASCPTPDEYPRLEPRRIAAAWGQRAALLASHHSLTAIVPSRWLAGEALAGLWRNHRVEVIPNGVPLSVFAPVPREVARQALGVGTVGRVLLAVAVRFADPWRGWEILLDSLRTLKQRPLTLLLLGKVDHVPVVEGVKIMQLGSIDHERTRALTYSAPDLVIHPATADNFPNTLLESLACGTPAVGLPIGGVPEVIREGVTGWLAPSASPEGLSHAVALALSELEAGVNLRRSCRLVAEQEFPQDLQADRYALLFAGLLSRTAGLTSTRAPIERSVGP